jgi:hypothetical protein
LQRTNDNRALASVQAVLAFGHHASYERIESLLVRKCYEAALTEAGSSRTCNLHSCLKIFARATTTPSWWSTSRSGDPKLLETVAAGRVPELKTYTSTCP